ncbi:MAG: hypothetical protein IJ167_11615 [Lachnospiraceae bacterium]|nr:hypothetical protein [Lachnospiraceae bacterium]
MGVDYDKYEMIFSEKLKGYSLGFVIAFGVIWIFYRIAILAFVGGCIGGIFGIKKYKVRLIKKRKDRLLEQFKSMLEALATSYSAGRNTLNAYKDAKEDLIRSYGETSYIVNEIELILENYNNNIRIEKSLSDFAKRTGLEDIKSFSEVYDSCHKAGGNIGKVISDTRQIITDKIDMEKEIETGINAGKSNLNLIVIIGLVIVVLTGADSSMSVSVNTPLLFGIKTVCLMEIVISYLYGIKLTEVKL